MTFWTWKWKCSETLLTDTYQLTCDYFSTKMKQKWKKKKSEITHKQLKVECIQLTKLTANIQKWNHYQTNVKWIMTILLMSVLTSEQTFDLLINSSNVKA